jgi:hypothetical protein
VKPRLVAVDSTSSDGASVPSVRRRGASAPRSGSMALPVPGAGIGRPARLRLCLSVRSRGGGTPEGEAGGARKRTPAAPWYEGRGSGGSRSCSRFELVAEVDERRSVRIERSGSSRLASPLTRGSSAGETAPEAGSRWRKPPAREQRHRWRAPRDPTRRRASVMRDRGREHSSMEGVRERCRPPPLTRRRRSRSSCPAATGMRQRCRVRREALTRTPEVVSQARRAVENTAGGRSSAEEPSIGAPPGLRWTAHVDVRGLGSGRAPPGAHVMVAARPKLEVRRQAKLHLVGSSGKRKGRLPSLAAAAHAQDGSALRDAIRRKARRIPRRSRESSEPQGARDGSRLQKSVRRILPAANAAPEPATSSTVRRRRERGVARGDPPALDGAGQARSERPGAGRGNAREQRAEPDPPRCKARVDPMEGVLVRPVVVVLTRRRQRRAWHDGGSRAVASPQGSRRSRGDALRGAGRGAGRSPRPRVHRATESARSSFVRSGFLSRWAQEVGGQR